MAQINACIDLTVVDGIALVVSDNPPVNALGAVVREGLQVAFTKAAEDPTVRAIVLGCKGRTFFAGADITEFGGPLRQPDLGALNQMLDASAKPVVAAIFGTALGGGLEIALSCHYRVATADASLGLPEVKLGLLPGAGGTQRLPRLIGPEKALAAIVSGTPMPAKAALAEGLVDEIVAEPIAGAVAFARRLLAGGGGPVRARDRDDKLAPVRADPAAFEAAAKAATRRFPGVEAPAACVEAVRNAFTLPFDAGLAAEQALFLKLMAGDQSRAQRYIFFGERAASKVPGMPPDVKPAKIARAAVIGAGTMGGGIAMCFANAGVPVTVVETGAENLRQGLERIRHTYAVSVERGALRQDVMDKRVALIAGATDVAAVAGADVVIEAVFEDMALKKELFAKLDRIARPGALLASNTSTLDIDAMAAVTSRPADVLGMHFFSPANVMKLLEIVRGLKTSYASIATAIAAGKLLGKVAVVVGNCHGFVGNRMLARRMEQMERLLLEGARPQDIDAVVTKFGFPMGLCAVADLAGIDVGWRARQGTGAFAPVGDALYAAGRYGQKTGSGYYKYEAGARTPTPDPFVDDLIRQAAQRLGIAQRQVSAEEIHERMTYPMISEAAQILAEGIAYRPADIDVVWVYGYGWPVWRGGPCFYADLVGVKAVCESLERYAALTGNATLAPAPLLREMASTGRKFSDYKVG